MLPAMHQALSAAPLAVAAKHAIPPAALPRDAQDSGCQRYVGCVTGCRRGDHDEHERE
jgi:hypothetical protein